MARDILTFDTRGSGDHTILLLHGFLGSGRNLMSLARRWSDAEPRLRLVFPDLTGHGTSTPLTDPIGIDQVASDVFALAEHIGADEPLTIVGHSFGGRTALAMRLQDPTRVGRIVLLDIAPGYTPLGLGGLDKVLGVVIDAPETAASRDEMRAYLLGRGISKALTEWVIMNLAQDGDVVRWRFDREGLQALSRSQRSTDLWPGVEAPGVETVLIRGADSAFLTEEDLHRYESANVDIITIPNAGHFLHVDAQSELLDHLVALKL